MQVEPFPNKDGYRVWLSKQEQQRIPDYYSEEPQKQLAVELMNDGLRSEETTRVSIEDVREMDTEAEGYMLRVWTSKTDFRECPISIDTYKKMKMIKNIKNLSKSDPLIDVTERTVQRWVEKATDSFVDDNPDWKHVTAHDLRRTWVTQLYWSLDGDRAREVVMSFGGWNDVQTFNENYLGRIPDSVAIEVMKEADLQ